jgi:glycosyltransferase involved in cell wall biosynthesis
MLQIGKVGRMRIVLLHYSALPIVGGVETVIGHHARLMAEAGHEVRIVAGRGSQTDDRIPFIHIPLADSRHPDVLSIKAELDRGRIPATFEGFVAKLKDSLTEVLDNTDFLIAHNVCSLNKNLILTAALRRIVESTHHPRLILWHHDFAWLTPRYHDELRDGYPWDLLRTHWPGAVQVVVSEFRRLELSKLINLPVGKIHVIPNGIDIEHFLKLEKKTSSLLKKIDIRNALPLLLLPVRITPRKNIELALRTLRVLKDKYPYAMLIVTGPLGAHNPANRQYFETLLVLRRELNLEGSAHFLAEFSDEFLPNEVVSDLFQLADALLLPSHEEGFGLPILEAGLARMPIFCADIPPLRELADGYASFFSPDTEPMHIMELIVEQLENDLTSKFQARVRTQFTWPRIYLEKIEPLLSNKG